MNHRKFGKKLGRNRRERDALFKSLIRAVFTHGAIETTEAKAKSVISIIEKLSNHLISKDAIISQRELSTFIQNRSLVSDIYRSFSKVFAGQTSNFTKTWKVRVRQGDDATIVKLTFVKPYKLEVVEKTTNDSKPAVKTTVKKSAVKKTASKKIVK